MTKFAVSCRLGTISEEILNGILHFSSSVYDYRYMKTKITTYGGKVYTNFCSLNMPEDDIKCESFTVVSIDSLLVYKNKY